MCCCIDYCWICRYPPPFFRCAKSWSKDATNPTSNSSRHQIRDFARGLLAGLVDNDRPLSSESTKRLAGFERSNRNSQNGLRSK